MCKDPALTYLNRFGYNVIRLPRENIDPLLVLAGSKSNLTCLGPVSHFIKEPSRDPKIERDQQVANITGKKTSKLSANIGLNLLSGFLSALGAAGGKLDAQYSNAKTIQLTFTNALSDIIYITQIDMLLSSSQPRTDGLLWDAVNQENEAYIIYETIKSNSFGVTAYDKKGAPLKLDLSGIKGVLDVNSGIEVSSDSEYTVVYKGNKFLRFGFKVIKFWIEKKGDTAKFRIKLIRKPIITTFRVETGQQPPQPEPAPVIFKPGELLDIKF